MVVLYQHPKRSEGEVQERAQVYQQWVRSNTRVWQAAPLSPGLDMPYPGQVAEYPTQACGVVEADTPPCWRAKGRKNTVCPLPAAHQRSTNTYFSAGFPRHMPGSLKEIYVSDLIQLS